MMFGSCYQCPLQIYIAFMVLSLSDSYNSQNMSHLGPELCHMVLSCCLPLWYPIHALLHGPLHHSQCSFLQQKSAQVLGWKGRSSYLQQKVKTSDVQRGAEAGQRDNCGSIEGLFLEAKLCVFCSATDWCKSSLCAYYS